MLVRVILIQYRNSIPVLHCSNYTILIMITIIFFIIIVVLHLNMVIIITIIKKIKIIVK